MSRCRVRSAAYRARRHKRREGQRSRHPVRIVDVARVEGSGYFKDRTSFYVLVSRKLNYIYSRSPNEKQHYYRGPVPSERFTGKDGPFYNFLAGTSAKGDAFAGSIFDIKLEDGTQFHCQGDVWSVGPPPGIDTVQVGVNSQEQLDYCYVFTSGEIERCVLDEWLANNTPKTEYYAFDKSTARRDKHRRKYEARQAFIARKQAACEHEFEDHEDEEYVGDESYPILVDRCTKCEFETNPRRVEFAEHEDDHL